MELAAGRWVAMACAAAVVLVPGRPGTGAAAPDVRGAWRLESYTGGGSVGPATGQLILTDDRFSLVYTMTGPDGTLSGRAHAGSHRASDDTLALEVDWSLDHVNGKGSVARSPSTRSPRFQLEGHRLTLTFENGAVQVYQRADRVP
jgi:hypothetical protein